MSNGEYDNSPWDVYETPPNTGETQDDDSCLPTKVYFAKERRKELFMKYKHVFKRTVNTEPADVPPMILKVED